MKKLNEKEWEEFTLEDIFSVGAGKRLTNADKIDGDRPFIGATDNNNGVTGFVGNDNASLDENVLGVNYNGAPCIAFYHPYKCLFTDDVKRLHLQNHADDEHVLLFMKDIVMQQRAKYSYGYKFKEKRMLRQKLMLPVDNDGKPDYGYMVQYASEMRGGVCSCGIRIMLPGSSPSWNTRTFRHWTRRSGKSFGLVSYLKSAVQKPETRTITTWGTYRLLRQEQ